MEKPHSVKSSRGKYILSKALYFGIKQLSKEAKVFTKDEETKKDLQDMQDLYHYMYDSYVPIQGWEGLREEVPRPNLITVTEHLSKQGGI